VTSEKPTKYCKKFVEMDSQKMVAVIPLSVYNINELVLCVILIGKERMQQEIWFQKYKIIELLGRGGTAEVYLAEHILLNSYRAIKFISKNHPLYDLQRNEAFILKNLKHSCIPIIYDIEKNEEGSYIVEEYLKGETLKDYISIRGIPREDIIIKFAVQLCELIHYLHSIESPIFYIDLKPDNIIVSEETLKLIDFGSAVYRDKLSEGQGYAGTRGYAAPELYLQDRIDERCDVYGIGMLLYYMASGIPIRKDLKGIENIDRVGHCSRKLKNIINRCLKYHPSQRYASIAKLIKHLSEMKHNTQFESETNQTLKIAIAGTQQRIGVTHFAIRFCNYAISQRYHCLYQEKNESGCVRSILNRYEAVGIQDENYCIEGIPMRANNRQEDCRGYQVIVQDYGVLTREKLSDFLNAEIKLLILGAKDWELEYSEAVLNMVAEYKDIAYLFNFMNGIQFRRVMQSMILRNCYRIPYEPDPFMRITSKNGLELFQELAVTLRERLSV